MDAPSFPLLLPTSSLTSTYWNHHISHSMLKLLEKALIILSSLNTEKIEDGEEVAVEEVEDGQSKMEGMTSIALLLDGSISGHFVQLPESVYYQVDRRWSCSSSHHDSQLLFAGTPIPPWFLIHADQSSQSSTIFCPSSILSTRCVLIFSAQIPTSTSDLQYFSIFFSS